jgi:hypothetical protein
MSNTFRNSVKLDLKSVKSLSDFQVAVAHLKEKLKVKVSDGRIFLHYNTTDKLPIIIDKKDYITKKELIDNFDSTKYHFTISGDYLPMKLSINEWALNTVALNITVKHRDIANPKRFKLLVKHI